jgi:hypothetical protein
MNTNDRIMLYYDDDGDELRPGDKVRVKMDEIRTIIEVNGRNILENWPDDETVYNLEFVWPPSCPARRLKRPKNCRFALRSKRDYGDLFVP